MFIEGTETILGTTTADENGAWSITLDPTDENLGGGEDVQLSIVAQASLEGEDDVISDPVTLTIDCPQDPVVITQPETITDCENTFVVSGTSEPGASITLFIEGTETILGTTTADENGAWSITLDPTDENLGGGEDVQLSLVAQASLEGEDDVFSDPVTLTINCPQDPVVITQPETITDCENTFVVSGTSEPGASITLFIEGTETILGTTTADENGAWSITLDPTDGNLGGGEGGQFITSSIKHR